MVDSNFMQFANQYDSYIDAVSGGSIGNTAYPESPSVFPSNEQPQNTNPQVKLGGKFKTKEEYANTVFANAQKDIKAADKDGDGKVSEQEFVSLFAKKNDKDESAKMSKVFGTLIDIDKNGADASEIAAYLSALDARDGVFDDKVKLSSIEATKNEVSSANYQNKEEDQSLMGVIKEFFGFGKTTSDQVTSTSDTLSENDTRTTDTVLNPYDEKSVEELKALLPTATAEEKENIVAALAKKGVDATSLNKKVTSESKLSADITKVDEYKNDANVKKIFKSMTNAINADNEDYMSTLITKLGDENPHKLAALEQMYGEAKGDPAALRKWVKSEFDDTFTDNESNLIAKLNEAAKVNPKNAAAALKESIEGIGTDEASVKNILSEGQSDAFVIATKDEYEKNGKNLDEDIRNDFSGSEQDLIINRLNTALVNGIVE